MTTWNESVARDVARALHDVNFYLGLARVNFLNGHDERAANFLRSAILAKEEAVRRMPHVRLDGRERLEFEEFYIHFWHKDLLMYQAQRTAGSAQDPDLPPDPNAIPWDHLEREFRRIAHELDGLLQRPWPPNDPCRARLEEVMNDVVDAADYLRDHPPDRVHPDALSDGLELLQRHQVEFLACTYPDSPVSMGDIMHQFNAMNLWMLNIYAALKYGDPPWGIDGNRVKDILYQIDTVEAFKATFVGWLEDAYPGTSKPVDGWDEGDPNVIPGVDPIPGLPPGIDPTDPSGGGSGGKVV